MDLTQTVPIMSFMCMILAGIVTVILPIVTFGYMKNNYDMSFKPFVFGMLSYFISIMVMRNVASAIILAIPGVSDFLYDNEVATIIFSTLLTAVFAEFMRYYIMKVIRKYTIVNKEYAWTYSFGYASIQALLTTGYTMLYNVLISYAINTTGLEAITEGMAESEIEEILQSIDGLLNGPSEAFLALVFITITTFMVQIAASVLTYLVITGRCKKIMILAAIVLHFVYELPLMLYRMGTIDEVMEIALATGAAILFFGVVYVIQKQYENPFGRKE